MEDETEFNVPVEKAGDCNIVMCLYMVEWSAVQQAPEA